MSKSKSGTRPGPQEDFYEHVNYEWLNDPEVVIPADQSRWGSFIYLVECSIKNQTALLEKLCEKENKTQDEEKLVLIWKASLKRFQDWEEGKGDMAPVEASLKKLEESLQNGEQGIAEYIGYSNLMGIGSVFGFGKESNLEDSKNVILDLSPSGMSLPARSYYFEPEFEEKRKMFVEHLNKIADIVGRDKVGKDFADNVLSFEKKIAAISMKKDQSRDFSNYYSLSTLSDMIENINDLKSLDSKKENYEANEFESDKDLLCTKEYACSDQDKEKIRDFFDTVLKGFDVRDTLKANYAANYPNGDPEGVERLMVFDGDFFRRVVLLLTREENSACLKSYFQYKTIKFVSDFCTKELNEEFFDFYGRKLRGQKEQKNATKRSIALLESWCRDLLGKAYVEVHFSAKDKTSVEGLIEECAEIMEESINRNDWLTSNTKAKALDKLKKFTNKIGYPEKWKDFSTLDISASDSLFDMFLKVQEWDHKTEFSEKVNAPKDLTEWEMGPATVNAYFHPLLNEIVFPAAILQPPFWSSSMDKVDFEIPKDDKDLVADDEMVLMAVNAGGILAVIAHEITHGYDDNGRRFDSDGNVVDWWTKEDGELFVKKTKLMVEQAGLWSFQGHNMNGDLCLGENLADLGGQSLSLQVLERACKRKGLTGERRKALLRIFFYSWANIWKCKVTDEYLINQLKTDPHAPTSFRGNLVKNIDAWYEAFDVKEGDPMWLPPDQRLCMW